jgi:hypothetical protein
LTPPTVARTVPWVSGAALMLRRTALDAVGGFDESYFMYFEEVDLCLRLRDLEWQTHFTPTATVVHVGGASTSQCRTEARIRHFRSTQQFYRRHYSERRAALWMALMTLKVCVRLIHDLVSVRLRSDARVRSTLAQHVNAWKAILSGDLDFAGLQKFANLEREKSSSSTRSLPWGTPGSKRVVRRDTGRSAAPDTRSCSSVMTRSSSPHSANEPSCSRAGRSS